MQFRIAKLNVGGRVFHVPWKMIVKRSYSDRLSHLYTAITTENILKYCDDYSAEDQEYFFDRHFNSFTLILHLLKFGSLYYSSQLCIMTLVDDFEYWGIDPNMMNSCCNYVYDARLNLSKEEYEKVHSIYLNKCKYVRDVDSTRCARLRGQIWDLMESPEKSRSSQIMAIISTLFVVISTVTLIISTLPYENSQTGRNSSSTKVTTLDDESNGILGFIELACIIWFTIEYVLRLFSCPNKWKFFTGFLNCIDFVAIVPYYAITIMKLVMINDEMTEKLYSIRQIMQIFRVLRILRILKLARHSVGLQSLGYTLKRSYNELGMLLMFISMGATLFSSVTYFAEKDYRNTNFTSIPLAMWWAIISMTTVGYGDMAPVSSAGQIVGSLCCVSGVLIISLPIPIIVSNFAEFYKQKMRVQTTLKKRIELEKARQEGSINFQSKVYDSDFCRPRTIYAALVNSNTPSIISDTERINNSF